MGMFRVKQGDAGGAPGIEPGKDGLEQPFLFSEVSEKLALERGYCELKLAG